MDQSPEKRLRHAEKLARQAATQMREAARLADQAAQIFQQALGQIYLAQSGEQSNTLQMSITSPRRKKKQFPPNEPDRQSGSLATQPGERFSLSVPPSELPPSSPGTYTWDDGDEWWKPLQTVALDTTD